MTDPRRGIPSVSALLDLTELRVLADAGPRDLVVNAVRRVLDDVRRGQAPPASDREWAARVAAAVSLAQRSSLRPVLNATGSVLHTKLGRAPLAHAAALAILTVGGRFRRL